MLVAMPVGDRPGTLARSLDSWARVRVPEDGLSFIFALEPGDEQETMYEVVHRYAQTFGWLITVHRNKTRLGSDYNPGHVLELAFRRESWVTFSGDDVSVASDVAEYLAWGRDCYEHDASVLAVCAFEAGGAPVPQFVRRDVEFSPACFGMWADRWSLLRDWDFRPAPGAGWGSYVQQQMAAASRCVLRPWQSRAQQAGRSASFVRQVPSQDYEER